LDVVLFQAAVQMRAGTVAVTPVLDTSYGAHEVETVGVSDNAAIRVLTMNRPDVLNAVNLAMMDELADAFTAAATDDAVKVLVLTGAGRAFSAGADISEMDAPQDPQGRRQSDMEKNGWSDDRFPYAASAPRRP
jgi:enoyl-CoA hydratase/carnithine racemase